MSKRKKYAIAKQAGTEKERKRDEFYTNSKRPSSRYKRLFQVIINNVVA
jgi:hypothetical protein